MKHLTHIPAGPTQRSGFTLIELLVTLVIAAILVAVAVPMFTSSISRANIRDAANSLLAAVELARSEAIRRGVSVSVCRVSNPWAAVPTCGAGGVAGFAAGDWASGWIIFAEGGALDGVYNAAVDQLVFTQEPFAQGNATRAQIAGGPATGWFAFNPDGTLFVVGGALAFNLRYPQAPATALNTATVTSTLLGQVAIAVN